MPDPIAFKIVFGEDSFLIGNVLNKHSVQMEMIDEYGVEIDSTVLFMPNLIIEESIAEFIGQVSPKILVTGNTKITPEELREYLSMHIEILETNKDGTVTITSDSENLEVRSFTSEKELVLH